MLRTTDRHPASVHCADNTPSMATRRLSSRRPVSARALRCGLRSSFLVPRHCAFPTFGRYDPATNDTASQARFVSFSAGRHPATGLSHAATSLSPSFSDLSSAAASCRRLRRTSCRRSGRFAPGRRAETCAVVQWGGIQPKETAGILPAEDAGRTSAGVVVPTACKCVPMVSRYAVGLDAKTAPLNKHIWPNFNLKLGQLVKSE